jgi:hypothetical protein
MCPPGRTIGMVETQIPPDNLDRFDVRSPGESWVWAGF